MPDSVYLLLTLGLLAARLALLARPRSEVRVSARLAEAAQSLDQRLGEGFRKTNEAFVNVMTRLATIDEAQKKIESLTGSVVGLQELLDDKRAFGEVQLEALVRSVLPAGAYEMQCTLSNGTRADCVLTLRPPTDATWAGSRR